MEIKVPYLKTAQEILVAVQPLSGLPAPDAPIQLGEKVIEYRYTANLPKEQVYDLVTELLTKGETRLIEGHTPERLTLADPTDRTTRGQARSLLDDFLGETTSTRKAWNPEPSK